MDVARLVDARAADIAAFTTATFRQARCSGNTLTPTSGSPGTSSVPLLQTVRYRRPASDNVPVSRVVRVARERAKRARSRGLNPDVADEREAAKLHVDRGTFLHTSEEVTALTGNVESNKNAIAEAAAAAQQRKRCLSRLRVKQYHRRVLPVKRWQLLLKRRRQLWQRRRALSVRRHRQRQATLRMGKTVAPCGCLSSAPGAAGPTHGHRTKRLALTWLPSHARLVSRFHMSSLRLVLPSDDAGVHARRPPLSLQPRRPAEHVTVAVAETSRRKHHRLLQRWCALLPKPLSLRTAPPSATRAPAAYLLADTSQTCVYHVELRNVAMTQDLSASLSSPSASAAPDEVLHHVAGALELTPSCAGDPSRACKQWSLSLANSPATETAARPRVVRHQHARAMHGHMRSGADGSAIVPVTLLLSRGRDATGPASASSSSSDACTTLYLCAPCPIVFRGRAQQALRIRLVSLWSPCGAVDRRACTWELWAPTATAAESTALLDRLASCALKCATRHCTASAATTTTTTTTTTTSAPRKSSRYDYDLFVCPAWAHTEEDARATASTPAAAAAQTLVLVQRHTFSEELPPRSAGLVVAAARSRRCLFHTARLFLGALLSVRRLQCVVPITARAYQLRVRLIGTEDRCTLRHLLGRPSFPQDFDAKAAVRQHGVSHPRRATLRREVAVHGTPANAAQRLLVGSARPDRRLASSHAQPGCLLVRVQWAAPHRSGATARVDKVGIVTTAPFFVHRLGRTVVLVWCLYGADTASIASAASEAYTTLVLVPPSALATIQKCAEDEEKKKRRRSDTRPKSPRRKRTDVDVELSCSAAARELLDESACTLAKCFPIHV